MPLGRTTKALWEFSYRLFVNIWQKPTEKTLVGHQHRLDNALLKDTQVRLTKCLVLIINTVEHETGVNYIFLHAGVSLKHCFKSLWMQHVVHRSQRRWWRAMGGWWWGRRRTCDADCRGCNRPAAGKVTRHCLKGRGEENVSRSGSVSPRGKNVPHTWHSKPLPTKNCHVHQLVAGGSTLRG